MKEYLNKNLYDILGTTPEADTEQIKAAYRKKARVWHPDVNNNTQESIEIFKEITEAYEFLIDVEKRKTYDQIKGFSQKKAQDSHTRRTSAKKAYTYAGTHQSSETFKTAHKEKDTAKANDKQSFSNVFETILDGLFPDEKESAEKYSNKARKPQNGRDINLNVTIKIDEALNGTQRTINVLHMEQCPKCEGRKFINGAKCSECKGTGEISVHKKLSVKIPPNVKNKAKIRIANEGNKGCFGGKDGDLYLHIDIEENKFFKYEGLNVYCEIPITPFEAALGANIEVPTIKENVSMKIPSGTTTGQKFRLSGEGLSDGKKRGDQIVTVKIEMKKEISEEEKALYEKIKNISHYDIRENIRK